jgi:hypothetical protein
MAANFIGSMSCSMLGEIVSLASHTNSMIAFVDLLHRLPAESNISDDTVMASNLEHSPFPVQLLVHTIPDDFGLKGEFVLEVFGGRYF